MKTFIVFFLVIVVLTFFACTEKIDIEVEKGKLETVLDKYHQAVNNENMDMLSQLFTPDEDLVWIPANENSDLKWTSINQGWATIEEAYKNWFSLSDKINYAYKNELIKIHPSGNSAWISCVQYGDELFQNEPMSFDGCRATFGLEKRNGNWVIVQAHWSFPKEE